MAVCRFYLKGNCKFGARCRYEHPSTGQNSQPNTTFGTSQSFFGGGQQPLFGGTNAPSPFGNTANSFFGSRLGTNINPQNNSSTFSNQKSTFQSNQNPFGSNQTTPTPFGTANIGQQISPFESNTQPKTNPFASNIQPKTSPFASNTQPKTNPFASNTQSITAPFQSPPTPGFGFHQNQQPSIIGSNPNPSGFNAFSSTAYASTSTQSGNNAVSTAFGGNASSGVDKGGGFGNAFREAVVRGQNSAGIQQQNQFVNVQRNANSSNQGAFSKELLAEDLVKSAPLWKLSCYGQEGAECVIKGDVSFEELRAEAYEQLKSGRVLSEIAVVEAERFQKHAASINALLGQPGTQKYPQVAQQSFGTSSFNHAQTMNQPFQSNPGFENGGTPFASTQPGVQVTASLSSPSQQVVNLQQSNKATSQLPDDIRKEFEADQFTPLKVPEMAPPSEYCH